MATIASQVVLHPFVSNSLKFGGTTLGRDKTYRAVQYFARFLAWYLLNKGDKLDAARWTALKSHLGTARKLLRLGKPMEHLQAVLRAAFTPGPAGEQILSIGRQIAYFGYLTYDMFVWAQAIKFINLNPETAKKVAKTSNRFWLAGILFSIVNSILKYTRLTKEAKKLRASRMLSEKDIGEEAQSDMRLSAIESARVATQQQFMTDALDVWIPATGTELVSINDGILGILGLITSLIGVNAQWKAVVGKK